MPSYRSIYQCEHCPRRFPSQFKLAQHREQEHQGPVAVRRKPRFPPVIAPKKKW